MIEKVDKSSIADTVAFTKGLGGLVESPSRSRADVRLAPPLGGYFRRFRGGALNKWVENPELRERMTIEERATLAFLQVSRLGLF